MPRYKSGHLEISASGGRWMLRSACSRSVCLSYLDGRSILVAQGMPAIIGLSSRKPPALYPALMNRVLKGYRKGKLLMSGARYRTLYDRFMKNATVCELGQEALAAVGYRAVQLPPSASGRKFALFEDMDAAMAMRKLLVWKPEYSENSMRGVHPLEFVPVKDHASETVVQG
ncbi:hypothetical protein AD929_12485 [Gluconobacter potus]|uniref:Uncharacterized protein n=1 Tax=Gluconobacter potus TaxID=2724927 RepID=A0A149QRW9_9PROT|nr:hypothetical protein [Gluconobacter potus]KXV00043.1 hypothetical protein AD929_12485 [Gluconobacter potus]